MSDLEDNNLREAELLLAMTTDNAGGETEPGHIKTPDYRQSDDEIEILAADTAWHNEMEEQLSENERYSIPSAQVRQKEQRQNSIEKFVSIDIIDVHKVELRINRR